ncbi:RelA/SpoT domain-containing protein [Granulicella rosea]|uniref:RelA/SpoT domain-containing protein n=1 Tax=Granulicella rosea TaxID=474952 RepID=UPI000B78D06A|nr:RelA/SpoT domain-containing protein [Granulicella rosea]
MSDVSEILKEFLVKESMLEAFGKKVHSLVEEILNHRDVRVHSVSYRVKKAQKVEDKAKRKNYERLDQVTDQLGLRIITYYEDEVDRVAALIGKEFEVDQEHSVDKRIQEDPEKFTYCLFTMSAL